MGNYLRNSLVYLFTFKFCQIIIIILDHHSKGFKKKRKKKHIMIQVDRLENSGEIDDSTNNRIFRAIAEVFQNAQSTYAGHRRHVAVLKKIQSKAISQGYGEVFSYFFNKLVTKIPVSYTHLDVYKRQIQSNGDEKGLPISNNNRYNTKKKPSIIKNLIVSELTGIYILATILMIRSNLPFGVSAKLNELLGEKFTVPNVVIDVWFDKVFAITCVLTLIGIKIAERTLTKMQ